MVTHGSCSRTTRTAYQTALYQSRKVPRVGVGLRAVRRPRPSSQCRRSSTCSIAYLLRAPQHISFPLRPPYCILLLIHHRQPCICKTLCPRWWNKTDRCTALPAPRQWHPYPRLSLVRPPWVGMEVKTMRCLSVLGLHIIQRWHTAPISHRPICHTLASARIVPRRNPRPTALCVGQRTPTGRTTSASINPRRRRSLLCCALVCYFQRLRLVS